MGEGGGEGRGGKGMRRGADGRLGGWMGWAWGMGVVDGENRMADVGRGLACIFGLGDLHWLHDFNVSSVRTTWQVAVCSFCLDVL